MRSPSVVSGGAPAASNVFVYTDKIEANFWPPMHKHTAAEMGKSKQIRDNKPKMRHEHSRRTVFFPGDVFKNRDCPGKYGTDGHLTYKAVQ